MSNGNVSEELPFRLSVSDEDLQQLRNKLASTRLPNELEGAGWNYGVPLTDIQRLVSYWQDGFDWRKVEERINELPMFTRPIQVEGHGTLRIHYVHKRSEIENAIPLLFVHGCEYQLMPSFCHAIRETTVRGINRAGPLSRSQETLAHSDCVIN